MGLKKSNRHILSRTSLLNWTARFVAGPLIILLFVTLLTSFGEKQPFSSRMLSEWSEVLQQDTLFSFFAFENKLYSSFPETSVESGLFHATVEIATNIDVNDPRTLLGKEIPGLAAMNEKIIVAGEGTNFSNMPVESAPPLEVLMEERETNNKRLQVLEDETETPSNLEKVAHIIHSHSRESYLPELDEGNDVAFHPDVNITLVGRHFGKELEKRGIGTEVDNTDIEKQLHENGWDFPQSYDVSRSVLEEAINENDNLELFFDLHRDSQPRDITTVTINGETLARTFFVIGKNNPHYEKNLEMATTLHNKLEEKYPGLSRGVIEKGGAGSNGNYNQDLGEKSILIEMGGIENNLEEVYGSSEILAEVISEFYNETKDAEGEE
ncbi:stage II sporulation protein P [Alteribacillus sp. HJP-4]|uniref:stage II sporulation protein P n=1 Tax=Alteribacillus sp. HJP-4 TaxID=2775394 RepID=UPI0035CD3674